MGRLEYTGFKPISTRFVSIPTLNQWNLFSHQPFAIKRTLNALFFCKNVIWSKIYLWIKYADLLGIPRQNSVLNFCILGWSIMEVKCKTKWTPTKGEERILLHVQMHCQTLNYHKDAWIVVVCILCHASRTIGNINASRTIGNIIFLLFLLKLAAA